ncbi:MAG TPA: acetate--CoA ligase family protein [Syntrophorhabdaceae bacterium]|nr:acetate--CoA ligase family protein [Syntrophorhabdaceae bacterium]
MRGFLFPESIAVFGVSPSKTNLGRVIVENLLRFKFKGDIYLIGDRDGEIMGRRIYKSIEDVDNVPELAVFLIPARVIPQALESCGRKGVRKIIIESGGFSEFERDRISLEKTILHIASKWDMKIVGPNCVGVINVSNGTVVPFYPLHPEYVKDGPVSLISQSGGLIHDIILLSSCENVGIGKLVSIGNKLMLDENDFLEFFISDSDTRIIGLYLESIKDGRRFMQLAGTTDKPIIVLKSNITPAGHNIAKLHTTALAGDDEVLDAALRQAGVHRVHSIQEMVECFKIFLLPILQGRNLVVISRSGGHAVLAADATYRHGFRLAELSDNFLKKVKEKSRAGVINFTNPLDLGDVFDIDFYGEIVKELMKEKSIDGLVLVHPWDLEAEVEATKNFIKTVGNISKDYSKPIVFSMISDRENWFKMKEIGDFPIFTDIEIALKMLSRSYKQYLNSRAKKTFRIYQLAKLTTTENKKIAFLPPQEVFHLLSTYGIKVAEYAVVKTLKEAKEEAKRIGYPVALKITDKEVLHKTEKAGVVLNILNEKELIKAFKRLNSKELIIQKMHEQGLEIILGGKVDPNFGPVILLGLGGVYTEVFKTKTLRIAPVDEKVAKGMIDELKGVEVLKGFRGKAEADTNALIKVLVELSRLLTEHPEITAIDVNPLILYEKEKGYVVVDGKIACIRPQGG